MYSVLKGSSYFLAHTPDMVVYNGTTQTLQRKIDPDSEYLKEISNHLRDYETCVAYPPNQVYIGNMTPEELEAIETPWYDKKAENKRQGTFGEIMPEDEFIGMMKYVDVFDLVKLKDDFSKTVKEKLDPIYFKGDVVGCVKAAHNLDDTLFAHVIFENLVSKASCTIAILHLLQQTGIAKNEIEYVLECSEEACGDMNQRGGGNFAKAAAEMAGLENATGSDVRGFCAGPTHALIQAASLVKSGVFKNVIVTAGGSTAKLGMNGKDHLNKELPILEDCVASFAVLISENDGVSPELNIDIVGRHTVGTGASPQKVISSLTSIPLEKAGLKLTDIDKYSVEMQNPDITKPAGAGNVPEANYKMIGALAVMKKQIEKSELADFVKQHGMVGWAPTQGHIPSGIPYLGFGRNDIMAGKVNRAMFVGKGSLFLGRMTNLFDGISFVMQKNSGKQEETVSEDQIKQLIAEALRDFASHLAGKLEE